MLKGAGLTGVGTAKKIGCRARRNRQRRRVQAALRNLRLPAAEWDCVVLLKPAACDADFTSLTAETRRLYDQCLSRLTDGSGSS